MKKIATWWRNGCRTHCCGTTTIRSTASHAGNVNGGHSWIMMGCQRTPLICRAVQMGMTGFDIQKAYTALKQMHSSPRGDGKGWMDGIDDYLSIGYPAKEFVIRTYNNSPANHYIQPAKLAGAPLNNCWIYHRELAAGKTLELWLGPKPNTNWGVAVSPVNSSSSSLK